MAKKIRASDAFELLGLDRGATPSEVKAAWLRKAKEHHPDHGGNKDTFHDCHQAYEVAMDLSRQPVACSACDGTGKVLKGTLKIRCKKCKGNGSIERT